MYYFKNVIEGNIVSLQTCINPLETDAEFIEITEEEYNKTLNTLSIDEVEDLNLPTYDELLIENEVLEKENAELLFKVLTGEELSDV